MAKSQADISFDIIANASPALIWAADLDKHCYWFNQRWLDFTGRSMAQECGDGWAQGVHPDDFPACMSTFHNAYDTHEPFTMSYRLRRHDGEFRWVFDHGVPQFDAEGRFAGFIGSCLDVTQEHLLRQQRDQLAERFQQLASRLPGAVFQLRVHARGKPIFDYVSEGFKVLTGLPPEDVLQDAETFFSLISRQDRDKALAELNEAAQSSSVWHALFRIHHAADGTERWVEGVSSPESCGEGGWLFTGHLKDVSDRKRAEAKLNLAAKVFACAREGIMVTDPGGCIVEVNDRFCEITGYNRDDLLGHRPSILQSGRHDKAFYEAMWRDMTVKGYWSGELWNRRKNGELFATSQHIGTVNDDDGQLTHFISLMSDITLQKEYEHKLEHIAHHDNLTRLPNRLLFEDRLRQAMASTRRTGKPLAVVFVDLDGFKQVNDRFGHAAGDQLLEDLASHMQQTLRASDTLARMGGDEFAAILTDLLDEQEVTGLLKRLLATIATPTVLGDHRLQVSGSIGVTFYQQWASASPEQLLKEADQAMYQAKELGKNRYVIYGR
ncbi:MAG: diguanylate cyclase [Marinobacter sp.]|nr:diguanylate cyclase [Marinobacter sp.]